MALARALFGQRRPDLLECLNLRIPLSGTNRPQHPLADAGLLGELHRAPIRKLAKLSGLKQATLYDTRAGRWTPSAEMLERIGSALRGYGDS